MTPGSLRNEARNVDSAQDAYMVCMCVLRSYIELTQTPETYLALVAVHREIAALGSITAMQDEIEDLK
jgi:hypothetical protein